MSALHSSPEVGMIWAQTRSGVIGAAGSMPWHLPEDLAHFKASTRGHPVVMGRRTWESFPAKFRPLPGRANIVITQDRSAAEEISQLGGHVVSSLDDGLRAAASFDAEKIWIIGGGSVYAEAVERSLADTAVVTVIETMTEGDTYAPELSQEWKLQDRDPASGRHRGENGLEYSILTYRRGGSAAADLQKGA